MLERKYSTSFGDESILMGLWHKVHFSVIALVNAFLEQLINFPVDLHVNVEHKVLVVDGVMAQ